MVNTIVDLNPQLYQFFIFSWSKCRHKHNSWPNTIVFHFLLTEATTKVKSSIALSQNQSFLWVVMLIILFYLLLCLPLSSPFLQQVFLYFLLYFTLISHPCNLQPQVRIRKMILKTSTLMTFSFNLISIERKTGLLPTVITLSQHSKTVLGLN